MEFCLCYRIQDSKGQETECEDKRPEESSEARLGALAAVIALLVDVENDGLEGDEETNENNSCADEARKTHPWNVYEVGVMHESKLTILFAIILFH